MILSNVLMSSIAALISVDVNLIKSICQVESNFRNVDNLNDNGSPSYGICQIKLATAQELLPGISVTELKQPSTNFLVAGLYLRHQLKRYNGSLIKAVSAYNAGRFIKTNDIYVQKVLRWYHTYNEQLLSKQLLGKQQILQGERNGNKPEKFKKSTNTDKLYIPSSKKASPNLPAIRKKLAGIH